jgi:hypothetical protein
MRTNVSEYLKLTLIVVVGMCCILFSSCDTDQRTAKAVEWVNTHPRPIVVTSISTNGLTLNHRCMFKDSAGVVYYAGEVEGFKPDTIK